MHGKNVTLHQEKLCIFPYPSMVDMRARSGKGCHTSSEGVEFALALLGMRECGLERSELFL